MENKNKKRAPNFMSNEKTQLLNIVFSFKNIIENKKTEAVTWKQKDETWEKITSIFNSQSPNNISRSKESLRKLYDNLKKNIRKEVVQEKKEIFKTGGGVNPKPAGPNTDILLDIINKKTVYGLSYSLDSDYNEMDAAESVSTEENVNLNTENFSDRNPELEDHVYCILDSEEEKIVNGESNEETTTTKDVNCRGNNSSIMRNQHVYKKKKTVDFTICNLREPKSMEVKHNWTKRRRPNIQQLSSSQLTEEYTKLAKLKIAVYGEEKDNVIRKRQREEELFNLEKRKLELEIELKELEVKKRKNESILN